VIQKTVKMHLARNQHQPRYKGIASLKKLQGQISSIGNMSSSLKTDRDSVLANAKKINAQLEAAIAKIKSNPKITKVEIDKLYKGLVTLINDAVGDVKKRLEKQKAKEEQATVQ
jgi:myosin-6